MQNILEKNDIENSLRFYLMLSIVIKNSKNTISNPERGLNEYIKTLKKEHHYNDDQINKAVVSASRTFPSEFRDIYGIPSSYGF